MPEMKWSENACGESLKAPWGQASVSYSYRDSKFFVVGRLEGKEGLSTVGRYESEAHAKQKATDWLAQSYFDVRE